MSGVGIGTIVHQYDLGVLACATERMIYNQHRICAERLDGLRREIQRESMHTAKVSLAGLLGYTQTYACPGA